MKKMIFDKTENWDTFTFYSIYNKENQKYIKINYQTDRVSKGKSYLSWIVIEHYNCEIPIKNLIEWDVYYQLQKIYNQTESKQIECEPLEAYEKANEYVIGLNGNGSDFKKILDIDMGTPCGDYYGY